MTGEIIYQNCGLVIQDTMLDKHPEWRAFTPEQRESCKRMGLPLSFSRHDKGLSTSIFVTRDAYGRMLRSSEHYKMLRLRRLNIRTKLHRSAERNLFQAMNVLNRLCEKLKIPRGLHESAAFIYRKALGKGLVRGRNIAGIATASLYLALRRANVPRTLNEIVDVSPRSRKEISRLYRLLIFEFNYKTPIDDPVQYVSKIATKAGISQKAQMRAIEILQKVRRLQISVGKGPRGLSATALYIACFELNEKTSQKRLAEAAGVSSVTIRNLYKSLIRDVELKFVKIQI